MRCGFWSSHETYPTSIIPWSYTNSGYSTKITTNLNFEENIFLYIKSFCTHNSVVLLLSPKGTDVKFFREQSTFNPTGSPAEFLRCVLIHSQQHTFGHEISVEFKHSDLEKRTITDDISVWKIIWYIHEAMFPNFIKFHTFYPKIWRIYS